MSRTAATKPIVLVHGAWHGAWCWDRVTPLLDAAGLPWAAVELPSCASPDLEAGLLEDVQEVERVLDELPGTAPAVLVGHSRGGLVVSEAGAHERVGHLVYLCAFLLEPDADPWDAAADTLVQAVEIGEDLMSAVKPDLAVQHFYNDCMPDDATWAAARVSPMYVGGGPVDPPRRAWSSKPTTYVVCDLDAAIPPHHQREMASLATDVVTWATGHSPFINRPDLVADLLAGLARPD